MCTAHPLDAIYPPTNFITIACIVLDMHWTKFRYKQKQRAITQRLSKQELRFMCTALPLDKIYPPTKFHNHSKYSFGDMHRQKSSMKVNRAIIKNKRAKMALGRSPDFFRLLLPIFFFFFLSLSEKNLQEFLYVCTKQKASIH